MNLIIPLAGMGSRFVEKGMLTPKYLIYASGKRIIEWVLDSINLEEYDQIILILLQEHCISYGADKVVKSINPKIQTVIIPDITEGTTCTVLEAENSIINTNLPVVIHTSDVWFSPYLNAKHEFSYDGETDAYLLTFLANNPSYSYTLCDGQGFVTSVREKERISRHANIGVYSFRSFKLFKELAIDAIKNKEKVKNEYYIAPLFNQLISKRGIAKAVEKSIVHVMGTPDELDFFIDYIKLDYDVKNSKIALVSDHSGFEAKSTFIKIAGNLNINTIDLGCYSESPCDYPDFIIPAAREYEKKRFDYLIAFCRSGQGVNITLNKFPTIISCLVYDNNSLKLALQHNCPNALAVSSKFFDSENKVSDFWNILSSTSFQGGRHSSRVQKVLNIS